MCLILEVLRYIIQYVCFRLLPATDASVADMPHAPVAVAVLKEHAGKKIHTGIYVYNDIIASVINTLGS